MMRWFRRERASVGAAAPAGTAAAERPRRGVLVVDGNIADAAAVVQTGDKVSEMVSTAYSIAKAVGLVARFRYKTILFAHEQIDGSGEDLVRQLRDRGLLEATRLYAMSAGNPTVAAMKYIGLPVDDFLAKPVPPAVLANLLTLPRKAQDRPAPTSDGASP